MKKTLLSVLSILTVTGAFAQLPVSTTSENKNVILQDFTGIYCSNCPAGNVIANNLKANKPNDVFILGVHSGPYSTPSGNDVNLRTSSGNWWKNRADVLGYPAGSINRRTFSNSQLGGHAQYSSTWSSTTNNVLAEASYVNLACETTIDTVTRLMTIDIEAYFTGTGPTSSVILNAVVTQDNIIGAQLGGSNNPAQ